MFRGPATLIRMNRQMPWGVHATGAAGCVLLVAAWMLLPAQTKWTAYTVIPPVIAVIYLRTLSRAAKPVRVSVDLYVDQSGVYADDAPLSYPLHLPSVPLTVELKMRSGRQLNIDPGGQGARADDILTALGFPATMCAPDHRAKTTGGQWVTAVLIVVLFVSALLCFSFYMATGY
jgi:hypothetical protein